MEAGHELDALIAEQVMGWHDVIVGPIEWLAPIGTNQDGIAMSVVPTYSTDISLAWTVVEHLHDQGWVWHISIGPTTTVAIERAGARHYDRNNVLVGPGSRRIDVRPVTLSDVPLAICRAALAAIDRPDGTRQVNDKAN